MASLKWDVVGERRFETGVDRGVFYPRNASGIYSVGEAWNGLTAVTESPSGAETTKHYADNIPYLSLTSAEEFAATIEAFMWPAGFEEVDGLILPTPGLSVGQQARKTFGLSYRTKIGNDVEAENAGYKLHLIYGCKAQPSEKAYATISDTTEPNTFSWELSTDPVVIGTINGVEYKPTSILTIDSTLVDAVALTEFEEILYGSDSAGGGASAQLPAPTTVIAHFLA